MGWDGGLGCQDNDQVSGWVTNFARVGIPERKLWKWEDGGFKVGMLVQIPVRTRPGHASGDGEWEEGR